MLRLEGFRRELGAFALSADFEVKGGERAGLVGRSGSGKTTLLRLIAGLDAVDAGRVSLDGRDITRLAPEARGIGYVFQEQALFPSLSVLENAAFALRMRGASREEREREAMPWLERVGLAGLAGASVLKLSGGERQRVAFVRALMWKPRVLLLDEPFSALDAGLRASLRSQLVELHELWPVPLILVTHDEADLEAVATFRLGIAEVGRERRVSRG